MIVKEFDSLLPFARHTLYVSIAISLLLNELDSEVFKMRVQGEFRTLNFFM